MRVKFGPWQPDQADLDQSGLEECVNALPRTGYYGALRENETLTGTASVGLAVGGSFLTNMATTTSQNELFVGTSGASPHLYRFVYPDGVGVDVARATFDRTASYNANTLWRFTRFGSSILAVDAVNAMQITNSGGTRFRDQSASASAPVAVEIATVRDFVFAGNIKSGGVGAGDNRVQWCQINNPQRWTPSPRSQSDYQDLPDTGAVVGISGGDFAAIFTGGGVWRATYVGSPIIFRFDLVSPNIAVPVRSSIARYQNLTFFLCISGFMVFDGAQCLPIGDGKVDRYFLENLTDITIADTVGVIDPTLKMYVVSTPDRDKLFAYHWPTQQWSQISVAHHWLTQALTSNGYRQEHSEQYPDIGIFTDDTTDANYNEFKGASYMTATFATGEAQIFSDKRAFVTGVRPLIQGSHDTSGTATTAITVEVGKRNVLTESVSYGAAVSVNANGMAPLRADARYHRVRVNVSGGFERAIGFDIDAKPSGKR